MAGPDITNQRDCNVYLLDLDREAVLIDTGFGAAFDRMAANIEDQGISPSRLDRDPYPLPRRPYQRRCPGGDNSAAAWSCTSWTPRS